MKNVLAFPPQMPTPRADRVDIATYGTVGTFSVDLIRLPTIMPAVETGGIYQVVVTGPPEIGFKILTALPDSDRCREFADVIGRAAFQALEFAEAARTQADSPDRSTTGAQP